MVQEPSKLELLREDIFAGRLNRRSVLKRGVALGLSAPVIATLLAACGDDDDDDDDADATEPAAATGTTGSGQATATTGTEATATTGGAESPTTAAGDATATTPTEAGTGHGRGVADLLRILYWQAPTILNVHFSQGTKDSAASSLVLEPLIDIDTEGNLIAVLAAEVPSVESGSVAEDGMSVTYTLKEGVVWSDGTPFTAEDVKFTYEYVIHPDATTTSIATYEGIESIEVIDDLTVTINFKEPTPGWYSPFATGFGGQIVPKHLLEGVVGAASRDDPFNLKPVGTGPYKVVEFSPGDVILYEINENYREADKPYFQRVEFKGGGDAPTAASAALQTGETDWAWNLQVEKDILEEMDTGEVGVLISSPGVGVERILVNQCDPNQEVDGARSEPTTQHPYNSDLKVRQAFAMAADRETVATQLYGPAGVATANILTGPEKFVSPNTSFTFDLEAAGALLDEAGWVLDGDRRAKDGVEMKATYQTTINSLRQKTQEVVKAGWEELGVSVELKSIDAGVFFSSDAGNPDTASHFYADFEMFTNSPSVPYPIAYMASWKSTDPAVDLAQKANDWAGQNVERWVNEEYNALYTQALTELDEAKQVELFYAMNEMVVNEVVVIPLVARTDVKAAKNSLKGYAPSPWTPDVRDIANWYLEEE